jgi:hypothetical protein
LLRAEHGRTLVALGRQNDGALALAEALSWLRSHPQHGLEVEQVALLEAELARLAGSPASPLALRADELLP